MAKKIKLVVFFLDIQIYFTTFATEKYAYTQTHTRTKPRLLYQIPRKHEENYTIFICVVI